MEKIWNESISSRAGKETLRSQAWGHRNRQRTRLHQRAGPPHEAAQEVRPPCLLSGYEKEVDTQILV